MTELWLKYKNFYENKEIMIKSRLMYGLFTGEILLNILSFFVILRSLNEILASFDIFALRCYNKRQGRKHRSV